MIAELSKGTIERKLAAAGAAWDDIHPAIESQPRPDVYRVRITHPAFTRVSRAGFPPQLLPPAVQPPADLCQAPVDMVYLWVDGSDPLWRARYRKHVGKNADGSRFTDAGELRASLRSVDLYAPWVRRVFVVTDRQRPGWLRQLAPRVTIVDHRDIIPAEHLPAFNSHAIEPWLHRIDGLAEHFLYANDDTFFASDVKPGQFFTPTGRALMPFEGNARNGSGIHNQACKNAADILDRMFGEKPRRRGWHQIKPYRRSMLAELETLLADNIASVCKNKRRAGSDIAWNTVLWPGYAIEKGYAVDSPRGAIRQGYVNAGNANAPQIIERTLASRPHVLCINNSTSEHAEGVKTLLAMLSPEHSRASARRAACLKCEHSKNVSAVGAICKKINGGTCARSVMPFYTAKVDRCPLGLWPA